MITDKDLWSCSTKLIISYHHWTMIWLKLRKKWDSHPRWRPDYRLVTDLLCSTEVPSTRFAKPTEDRTTEACPEKAQNWGLPMDSHNLSCLVLVTIKITKVSFLGASLSHRPIWDRTRWSTWLSTCHTKAGGIDELMWQHPNPST